MTKSGSASISTTRRPATGTRITTSTIPPSTVARHLRRRLSAISGPSRRGGRSRGCWRIRKVLGPSAVNEARVDFTRIASVSNQPTDPSVSLNSLGFVTDRARSASSIRGPTPGSPCRRSRSPARSDSASGARSAPPGSTTTPGTWRTASRRSGGRTRSSSAASSATCKSTSATSTRRTATSISMGRRRATTSPIFCSERRIRTYRPRSRCSIRARDTAGRSHRTPGA